MQRFKHISFVVLLLVLTSCNVGPQAIDYGKDGCHFCKMTIVDKLHAAEIVTNKGKIYKFDASECMINFMEDFDAAEVKSYLTNVYRSEERRVGKECRNEGRTSGRNIKRESMMTQE